MNSVRILWERLKIFLLPGWICLRPLAAAGPPPSPHSHHLHDRTPSIREKTKELTMDWFTTCVWNNMIKASQGAEGQTSAPANPPVSSPVTSMQRLWPRLVEFRPFPPKSATFLPEPPPSRTFHFELFWSWTPGFLDLVCPGCHSDLCGKGLPGESTSICGGVNGISLTISVNLSATSFNSSVSSGTTERKRSATSFYKQHIREKKSLTRFNNSTS